MKNFFADSKILFPILFFVFLAAFSANSSALRPLPGPCDIATKQFCNSDSNCNTTAGFVCYYSANVCVKYGSSCPVGVQCMTGYACVNGCCVTATPSPTPSLSPSPSPSPKASPSPSPSPVASPTPSPTGKPSPSPYPSLPPKENEPISCDLYSDTKCVSDSDCEASYQCNVTENVCFKSGTVCNYDSDCPYGSVCAYGCCSETSATPTTAVATPTPTATECPACGKQECSDYTLNCVLTYSCAQQSASLYCGEKPSQSEFNNAFCNANSASTTAEQGTKTQAGATNAASGACPTCTPAPTCPAARQAQATPCATVLCTVFGIDCVLMLTLLALLVILFAVVCVILFNRLRHEAKKGKAKGDKKEAEKKK